MHCYHRNKIRGGKNIHAKLHMAARFDHIASTEEMTAIAEKWSTMLGLELGYLPSGGYEMVVNNRPGLGEVYFCVDSRRLFAILPAFIRLAIDGSGDLSVQLWDAGPDGSEVVYTLKDEPADFWREIALAQMYYYEEEE